MDYKLLQGDCLKVLKTLKDNSVSALVTDPPAGIAFMGKDWDKDKGGSKQWIAWMEEVMVECLRVLKPGAHGLVWAIPRTSHWTATALENAGFEVRDVVTHLFGTGFPKSLNVEKATKGVAIGQGTALKPAAEMWILVTKPKEKDVCDGLVLSAVPSTQLSMPGLREAEDLLAHTVAEMNVPQSQKEKILQLGRAVNGLDTTAMSLLARLVGSIDLSIVSSWKNISDADFERVKTFITLMETSRITDSKTCNSLLSHNTLNFTTGSEHYILIRKPLEKGLTVAANVLKWGTGGINIDGCRIGTDEYLVRPQGQPVNAMGKRTPGVQRTEQPPGRFPANLVLDEQAAAMLDEQSGISKSGVRPPNDSSATGNGHTHGKMKGLATERGFADTGGASRFFYVAKASTSEKNSGLEDSAETTVDDGRNTPIDNPFLRGRTPRKNTHPTVKSTKLMEYLIKLVTPPGKIVLDPFMGSGSTGVAALKGGFKFLGIEQEAEYLEIAKKRIEAA